MAQQLQWDLLNNAIKQPLCFFTFPPLIFISQTSTLPILYPSTAFPVSSWHPSSAPTILLSLVLLLQVESKMARGPQPSASLLILGIVLLCFTSGSTVRLAEAEKTWCVAKPSADEKVLQGNINYACSNVSCSVIQPGGPCFYPNNMASHASVAMNLYFAANGRHAWNCFFQNSALTVQSDPSYGSCTYY